MSVFTEQKVLTSINYKPEFNTVEVSWANKVFRDAILIANTIERKAYNQDQKDQFISEVEGGNAFSESYGW